MSKRPASYPIDGERFAIRGDGAQVKAGSLFSFPHRLEVDLAERLCDVIPCAENIRFVKTGSEACAGAASIARSYTGRDVIL